MKDSEFSNIIINSPEGATHYRRRQRSVTFFRDIDNEHGSYASISWWSGDKEPFGEWYTRRSYLDLSKVQCVPDNETEDDLERILELDNETTPLAPNAEDI